MVVSKGSLVAGSSDVSSSGKHFECSVLILKCYRIALPFIGFDPKLSVNSL